MFAEQDLGAVHLIDDGPTVGKAKRRLERVSKTTFDVS